MKIVHIIHGVHNPSAGPTYSVARLVNELYKLGEDASVLTLGRSPDDWPYDAPLKVHGGITGRRAGISMSLMREIHSLSKHPCILHGHGIWRVTNLFSLLIARDAPARVVHSPRGTLSEWSMDYKAHLKKPFWEILQKPALDRCHCFHATAPIEYKDIRRVGLNGPITLIPNGIDVPDLPAPSARKKQALFISRIDPVKGLDMLLPTWKSVADEFPDWELLIAGPLESSYATMVQELARNAEIPRIRFLGEVRGERKHELLASASLFLLPSYSENFCIAVAEALAFGVPVITTTATPWQEIVDNRCGWYIKPEREELQKALRFALGHPLPALHEMGQNGRAWMEQSYSWRHIAEMMRATYHWLLHKGPEPDCIRTS